MSNMSMGSMAGMNASMGQNNTKAQSYQFTKQARNRNDALAAGSQAVGGMPMAVQQPIGGEANPDAPLTASALAAAPPQMQKQMLGEQLFPKISKHHPELAGKITGMMLGMDNSELLILLESEASLLSKVAEALRVLEQAQRTTNPHEQE